MELDKSLKELQELGAVHFNDIEIGDILNHVKGICDSVANDTMDQKDPGTLKFRLKYRIASMYLNLALKVIE